MILKILFYNFLIFALVFFSREKLKRCTDLVFEC